MTIITDKHTRFDRQVYSALFRITRNHRRSVSHYEVARWMFDRPNGRTFDRVLASLQRLWTFNYVNEYGDSQFRPGTGRTR
jgi:hypothetical protein